MNSEKEELYQSTFDFYFKILESEGDRGAVLTASAFIEHELSKIMRQRFPQQEESDKDHIFGSHGVLSGFDSKLKFAYRFHILTKEEISFFDGFRKNIRNPFAHNFTVMNLASLRDKFIGVLQSLSPINSEVKSLISKKGMQFNETPTRYLFNITMALIMTDLSFFEMTPKFFKVQIK
ncbi:hypothetical protein [uncultured Psychromonas sp.]|uniref:hypothetical protein n=1 Tax=uncultured Psychromonas sp. TaxID=173974 RepID=UPI00261EE358|nr:hypothetical protein [uncultured Psychromonas sp.]